LAGSECTKRTAGMHEYLQSNNQGLHPVLYGIHSLTGQATQTV